MDNILKFDPIYKERVWGGRSLEKLYKRTLPSDDLNYGESWEIVDRPNDQSRVLGGKFDGETLNFLWSNFREDIFGCGFPDTERFPLLYKILDARKKLSLQVHPPESSCGIHGGEPKTEFWYVADAEPDSFIYYGLKEGVSEKDFQLALDEGKLQDHIKSFPVKKGDFIYLPSGCLHAIGEGIVIFEIQQNSDTTYRVYDWGRMGTDGKPRKLHKEQALSCISYSDNDPIMGNQDNGTMVKCDYFNVGISTFKPGEKKQISDATSFAIYSVIEGSLRLDEQILASGDSFIYPATRRKMEMDFFGEVNTKIIGISIPVE